MVPDVCCRGIPRAWSCRQLLGVWAQALHLSSLMLLTLRQQMLVRYVSCVLEPTSAWKELQLHIKGRVLMTLGRDLASSETYVLA